MSQDAQTLFACPCCGFATLDALGAHEICAVCEWEDDGLDNRYAGDYSPANRSNLNLARARFLRDQVGEPGDFERARFFVLSPDELEILELGPADTVLYRGWIPRVDYVASPASI
jgi:hypothetical protein